MKQRLVVNWRVETVRGFPVKIMAVQRYVQCVDNIDMSETLAVVILNSPAYAGTTYLVILIRRKWLSLLLLIAR